jgi:hypothetical protein
VPKQVTIELSSPSLSEGSAKACSPKLTFTTWLIMSWTLQIAEVWSTFHKGYIHKTIEFPKLN